MAGAVLLAFFAAFGVLSLVWTLVGWLLPAGEGWALVCLGEPDEGNLSRFRWLRAMGFLRCPLLAVPEETENWIEDALLPALGRELEHGTGTGDFTGRSQRSGISEL